MINGGNVAGKMNAWEKKVGKLRPGDVYIVDIIQGKYVVRYTGPEASQILLFWFRNLVKDPLKTLDKSSITTWHESYDVAQKLISGEIVNPSTATHFHGIGVTKEWFIEHVVPQGKFLKQIDDTYFYWSPN